MKRLIKSYLNRNLIIDFLILCSFCLISLIYFKPVLSGKKIKQSDIDQFSGMSRQIVEHREKFNEEPYWLDNAFLGMPTYQVAAKYPFDVLDKVDNLIRFLPRPADYLFVYLLSFFLLLKSMKVRSDYAFFGSIAFAFSTYLIIILGVGHNTKALAIGYTPLALAGLFKILNQRILTGILICSIGLGLQINANHYQMTYYFMMLMGLILIISTLIVRNKNPKTSFTKIGAFASSVLIAILLNSSSIMATKEYSEFSTRGSSDISINADGSEKQDLNGLSKDYITEYSYGKLESLNLIIPRFMGGGSSDLIEKDTEFFKSLSNYDPQSANLIYQNARLYWGDQPIVAAPAYIGISVFYLFIISLFYLDKKTLGWVVPSLLFALFLSWGKNFSSLTNLMIDYFPFYDKFRAVSSIQVIIELLIPLIATIGVFKIFEGKNPEKMNNKKIIYPSLIFIATLFLFLMFGESIFSFQSEREVFGAYPEILDMILNERKSVFREDVMRSIFIVSAVFISIFAVKKKYLSKKYIVPILTIIVLIDLWSFNMNYVNDDNFTNSSKVKTPFNINEIDKEILSDKSDFRVYESFRGFVNGRTSFFHNSISGYHAAKPKRMQDIYDFYLLKNELDVLDMLNVKYIIDINQSGNIELKTNQNVLGSAWFVDEVENVESPNEELLGLSNLDFKTKCISVNLESKIYNERSKNKIKVVEKTPNKITYKVSAIDTGFIVFSEAFYKNGWEAKVNGQIKKHQKVNYLLRGLEVEKGEYEIVFSFDPPIVKTGSFLMAGSNILLLILIIFYFRNQLKNVR
ncbi:MAG: hypothetical protein DBW74_03085 [Cryomorphaceae bacterium]|nr:MAG: hypothetical protein DBW74_03085 [Cryomorphaceae bacterium]